MPLDKFTTNNIDFETIKVSLFFTSKSFYIRISIELLNLERELIYKGIEITNKHADEIEKVYNYLRS